MPRIIRYPRVLRPEAASPGPGDGAAHPAVDQLFRALPDHAERQKSRDARADAGHQRPPKATDNVRSAIHRRIVYPRQDRATKRRTVPDARHMDGNKGEGNSDAEEHQGDEREGSGDLPR